MCQIIDFINILNELLTFLLCVIIYLERSLWSHEIWVCLIMVRWGNLLSIKCQSYYCSNIILVLRLVRNCLISFHSSLPVNTICSLENLLYFSLTFRKILIWIFIIFGFDIICLAVGIILNNWLFKIIISLEILAEFSILIELIWSLCSLWI